MTKTIAEEIEHINNMSHIEMAKLWRFSDCTHNYFNTDLPFSKIFEERFKKFGGMTPAISKRVGWDG